MKRCILIITLVFSFFKITFCQNEYPQTVEYSTVCLKVFYQGNIIHYDKSGISKSPTIGMPDGTMGLLYRDIKAEKEDEFQTIDQVLNYMASYGWVLKTSNITPYAGDSGNTSSNTILNTNKYLQVLVFEREKHL